MAGGASPRRMVWNREFAHDNSRSWWFSIKPLTTGKLVSQRGALPLARPVTAKTQRSLTGTHPDTVRDPRHRAALAPPRAQKATAKSHFSTQTSIRV